MDDETMPTNFGPRLVFWMICRWIYKNPLTLLLTMQLILLQLVADYPTLKWLGTAASVFGIIVAQVRNKGTDYSIPISESNRAQAHAVLASTSPTPPAQPASQETPK